MIPTYWGSNKIHTIQITYSSFRGARCSSPRGSPGPFRGRPPGCNRCHDHQDHHHHPHHHHHHHHHQHQCYHHQHQHHHLVTTFRCSTLPSRTQWGETTTTSLGSGASSCSKSSSSYNNSGANHSSQHR